MAQHILSEEEYSEYLGLKQTNSEQFQTIHRIRREAGEFVMRSGCAVRNGGYCDKCPINVLSPSSILTGNKCLAGEYMDVSK